MATFTLSVVGYLDTRPRQTGLTPEQVEAALQTHRELYRGRVQQALEWASQAQPGESWQTVTDLQESDQADIYLRCE